MNIYVCVCVCACVRFLQQVPAGCQNIKGFFKHSIFIFDVYHQFFWLNLLVDVHQFGYITKLKKKTLHHQIRWWCIQYWMIIQNIKQFHWMSLSKIKTLLMILSVFFMAKFCLISTWKIWFRPIQRIFNKKKLAQIRQILKEKNSNSSDFYDKSQ